MAFAIRSTPSLPAITARPAKTFATALCLLVRCHIPGGFELTTLTQAESARPFTITNKTAAAAFPSTDVSTSLDEFRGTPYIQMDLRVSRPIKVGERWQVYPFAEFFNLFNRNNPGANFVANIAALPVRQDRYGQAET